MKISECHYAVEVPSVISQVGEYPEVFVPVQYILHISKIYHHVVDTIYNDVNKLFKSQLYKLEITEKCIYDLVYDFMVMNNVKSLGFNITDDAYINIIPKKYECAYDYIYGIVSKYIEDEHITLRVHHALIGNRSDLAIPKVIIDKEQIRLICESLFIIEKDAFCPFPIKLKGIFTIKINAYWPNETNKEDK